MSGKEDQGGSPRVGRSYSLPASPKRRRSRVDEKAASPQQSLSRQQRVTSFLRLGQANEAFAAKAPSIISSSATTPDLSPTPHHVDMDLRDVHGRRNSLSHREERRQRRRGLKHSNTARGMHQPLLDTPPVPLKDPNEDFLTVDWARDRDYYIDYQEQLKDEPHGGCKAQCMRSASAMQGWLLCFLVGMCTGMAAALVDIGVHWTIDLRNGYCSDSWWLGYGFCCNTDADMENTFTNRDACPRWHYWPFELGGASPLAVAYSSYIVLSVLMAGLSAWLVTTFAPYAKGSGIPEVKTILGGVVIKRYLGLWTLVVKCVGLILSVGSGLSLGKEGPYVHVAGCFSNVLSRYFPKYRHNQAKKNEMLSAAAAAGVAVAFGAPVGGVLFSLEEVSTYFPRKTMWRSFFAAIVAAITLKLIDPSQTGKLVLFEIDSCNYNLSWKWFEMVPFALLGVLGGIIGVFFIRMNLKVARFRKYTALKRFPVLEVMAVALFSSVIQFHSKYLRGSQTAVLAQLFQECGNVTTSEAGSTLMAYFFTAAVTLVLTIFTFGIGVPAGLFIPSMVTGATIGRALGIMLRVLEVENPSWGLWGCSSAQPCVTPGIYALVGAAAVLGGVTRMTVSLVVIMFELTGGLTLILPIMVGIITSKWVGDAFGRHGIYDEYIHLYKYPFLESEDNIPLGTRAEDVMSKEVIVVTMHGHTVDTLFEQLRRVARNPLKINGFPVVTSTSDMLMVGYITRTELQRGLEYALSQPDINLQTRCYFAMVEMRFPRNAPYVDMRPWMHPTPLQVVESTPLHRIYHIFTELGLRYVLVTRFGKLVGIITKKDIYRFCRQHVHE